ncbi:hypothetical protein [Lysobacter gummosus]
MDRSIGQTKKPRGCGAFSLTHPAFIATALVPSPACGRGLG